jgi:tRNA uridine 5-carboxymethylaminomethyl modification enzyme
LTQIGRSAGLVDDTRWARFESKLAQIEKLKNHLKNTATTGADRKSLWDQLRRPHNPLAKTLREHPDLVTMGLAEDVLRAAIIDAKYEGYLVKQQRLVATLSSLENKKIPEGLDYGSIAHLRLEAKEKLSAFGPGTLAQASRISGITPADITVIQIHMKKEISNIKDQK